MVDGVEFIFRHGPEWVESVLRLFPGWLFGDQVACLGSVGPPTAARHGATRVLELGPKVLKPACLPSNSGRDYTSKAGKQVNDVGGVSFATERVEGGAEAPPSTNTMCRSLQGSGDIQLINRLHARRQASRQPCHGYQQSIRLQDPLDQHPLLAQRWLERRP